MSKPQSQRFDLAIGQAKTLVIQMDEAPASNVSANTMRFRMRNFAGTVVIEKSSGSGIICTSGTLGIWHVTINAADTVPLPSGIVSWSFWNVTASEESPVALGSASVYATADRSNT